MFVEPLVGEQSMGLRVGGCAEGYCEEDVAGVGGGGKWGNFAGIEFFGWGISALFFLFWKFG